MIQNFLFALCCNFFAVWRFSKANYLQKKHVHWFQIIVSFVSSLIAYGLFDTIRLLAFMIGAFIILHNPFRLKEVYLKINMWLYSFFILSVWHFARPEGIPVHVSGSVMLMVIKLTTLCSFKDSKEVKDNNSKPHLVPFLGWLLFVPSFLVGPTLTFQEYQKWVANVVNKETQTPKEGKSSVMWSYCWWILFFGLNTLLLKVFPFESLYVTSPFRDYITTLKRAC